MKKYKFKINGQTYEVEVNAFDGNNATVDVNGTSYNVEVVGEEIKAKTPVLARTPVVNKPGEGEIKKATSSGGAVYKVESPLPGTVFKLKVAVGDTVKTGETIMIMEAMKMENNIITEKGGVIRSIKVREGDAVLQGAVLVEIDL
ncbi:biotin/lipoyl-binding protein [Odoribacter sp. OttesenSCG-928-J03]|nr:biotin/lipoyl-binding protein [Odoribacter sp. OttesenSCG-928-J03]